MNRIKCMLNKADQALFLTIFNQQSYWQTRFFSLITGLGGVFFQAILILCLLLIPATAQIGFKLGVIQIIVVMSIQVLKRVVARIRPCYALSDIDALKVEKDYSFPSGHTAAAFVAALFISNLMPTPVLFAYPIAVLIGYSRIYLGVHYPSDVLAGCLIGLVVTAVML